MTPDELQGRLAEYSALREQIGDADKACISLLGVLLTLSTAIVGFTLGQHTPPAAVAWLLGPVWLVGHMYLAEKRIAIVETAKYLRENVERGFPGLNWETKHKNDPAYKARYLPFRVEQWLAVAIAIGDVFLVLYCAKGEITDSWFLLSVGFAAIVFSAACYSESLWNNYRS